MESTRKVIQLEERIMSKTKSSEILPRIKYGGGSLIFCLERALDVSLTNSTVLIEGETGTGKQMIAELIHEQSTRSNHGMITVDCSALEDNLMLSDLFGHRKGAFTGADYDKKGFFEIANESTIFLDEIGELPLAVQARLLRILQEGAFCRLGETRVRKTDVRVIVATNKILEKETAEKRFRKDLFYRLDVYRIKVPSLRNRPGDIPVLAEHFKSQEVAKEGIRIISFSEEAMLQMKNYSWPGNVRELQNAIARALINCKQSGTIEPRHLELKTDTKFYPSTALSLSGYIPTTIEEYEKVAFCLALHLAGKKGQSGAARILGISRRSAHNKIRIKHNINTDNPLGDIKHLKATNFPIDVTRLRTLELANDNQATTTETPQGEGKDFEEKEALKTLLERMSQRDKSISFLQDRTKTLLGEKKNAITANKNASKKILNLETKIENLKNKKIKDIRQIGKLKTIENKLRKEIAKLKNDLAEEVFKTLHLEKELVSLQDILEELKVKLGMVSRPIPQEQTISDGIRFDFDSKEIHSDMESSDTKLIIDLVINKHNGVAKKALENHLDEFEKIGLRTEQMLQRKIRLLNLADRCKKSRHKYCKEIITKKLLKKHSYNYFSVAKEIGIPGNEVSKFCELFLKSNK